MWLKLLALLEYLISIYRMANYGWQTAKCEWECRIISRSIIPRASMKKNLEGYHQVYEIIALGTRWPLSQYRNMLHLFWKTALCWIGTSALFIIMNMYNISLYNGVPSSIYILQNLRLLWYLCISSSYFWIEIYLRRSCGVIRLYNRFVKNLSLLEFAWSFNLPSFPSKKCNVVGVI